MPIARPIRRSSLVLVHWLAALVALLILSCSSDGDTRADGSASATLRQATVLTASDAQLAARLAPTTRGFALRHGIARGPGEGASSLVAELPPRADAAASFAHGLGEAHATRWTLESARAVPVEIDAGRAVYRDALAHADVVVTAEEERAEVFIVLRDEAAPTTFRWRVALGAGLARGVEEATGGVVLVDATGRKRLRVGAAFAVDSKGVRREAKLAWNEGGLTLRLDARGLAFPVLVDPVVEVVQWELAMPVSSPSARYGHAMAYDSARGKVVLFGGAANGPAGIANGPALSDTWEWDGTSWTQRTPTTSPPASSYHAMAYDSARGKVVLFGAGLTWEWDGTNWTQRMPATSPPARLYSALAYDSARAKVVLFGGSVASNCGAPCYLSDTWEWDGTNWTQRTPMTSPPARELHALAYDGARGKVMLFGGRGAVGSVAGILADTWEWDGTNWTQRTPATSPPPRDSHALAYDSARERVVLFGGYGASGGFLSDTWEWDGTNWTQRTPATSPPARDSFALAYDSARGKVLLFGGASLAWVGGSYQRVARSDTWEWDGTSWTQWTRATSPPARDYHALAYDSARAKVVLFGGSGVSSTLSDTWEWDGTSWTQRIPTTSPPGRAEHAMAYDSARARVVLFGGQSASGNLSDTWEWDGTSWTQRTLTTSPPARYGHALAYDSARGKIVLFGGYTGCVSCSELSDTWEWDGTSWTQRTPTTSPPGRYGHALAYDGARGKLLLFGGAALVWVGGIAQRVALSDTWEWDGTSWTQRTPATSPSARDTHALAYDSGRARVVLFGGYDASGGFLSDTWEWDGTSWAKRAPATSPPARDSHALAYDGARRNVVLFGGLGPSGMTDDTWIYSGYGGSCTTNAQCDTGFCVDGVCCQSACGGNDPNDCVVCSAALGATADGVCTTLANGASCNDGNACTQTDTCLSGSCDGANPVTCMAIDQCHVAGTCDPATGCSNPPLPDGTACNDGSACTQTDTCQAGTCTGANPVTCAAADDCHIGTCDPATGACSTPAAPDGTACNDGNACTQSDTCQSGTCVGTNPVSCAAPDACQEPASCDPASGCVYAPKPAGTSCRAAACAAGQAQPAATCDGTSGACPTTTPVDCGRYACAAGACHTSCTSDGDCATGYACAGGACTTPVVDAGTDAGASDSALDSAADAADLPPDAPQSGGCTCRAAPPASRSASPAIALVILALLSRRSRRG